METKKCTKCGKVKNKDCFYKQKAAKDNLSAWCKECHRQYDKKWRKENKEHRKKYNKKRYNEYKEAIKKRSNQWRKKHPDYDKKRYNENKEAIKKRSNQWREEHLEYHKNYCKKWRKNNPERAKLNKKKWVENNRDYKNFLNLQRQTRKQNAEGSHTFEEWKEVKEEYNYTCPGCGKKEPEITLTQDHIIPLDKDGSDNIENIQPLCRSCNSQKHTQIIFYNSIKS